MEATVFASHEQEDPHRCNCRDSKEVQRIRFRQNSFSVVNQVRRRTPRTPSTHSYRLRRGPVRFAAIRFGFTAARTGRPYPLALNGNADRLILDDAAPTNDFSTDRPLSTQRGSAPDLIISRYGTTSAEVGHRSWYRCVAYSTQKLSFPTWSPVVNGPSGSNSVPVLLMKSVCTEQTDTTESQRRW